MTKARPARLQMRRAKLQPRPAKFVPWGGDTFDRLFHIADSPELMEVASRAIEDRLKDSSPSEIVRLALHAIADHLMDRED